MLFSIVGFEVALESYLVFLIHLCNMSFPLQEFPSSPPLFLKFIFILRVRVFVCISVCALRVCSANESQGVEDVLELDL